MRDPSVIKKWLRLDEADVIEPDEKAHEQYSDFFKQVWSPTYAATESVDAAITSWSTQQEPE